MYRSVFRHHRTPVEANLTPLIDVAFQLIIFFMLAGAFASMERVSLEVPELASTKRLDDLKLPHKAVVNVLPEPGSPNGGVCWQLGAVRMAAGDTARLAEELSRARINFAKRQGTDSRLGDARFQVEVRADRSVLYSQVRPVLDSVAAAGFQRVHYVAVGGGDQ